MAGYSFGHRCRRYPGRRLPSSQPGQALSFCRTVILRAAFAGESDNSSSRIARRPLPLSSNDEFWTPFGAVSAQAVRAERDGKTDYIRVFGGGVDGIWRDDCGAKSRL